MFRVEVFAPVASVLEKVITAVAVTNRFLLQPLFMYLHVLILAILLWFAELQFNLVRIVFEVWLYLICQTRINILAIFAR